jgi:hypothetical protein
VRPNGGGTSRSLELPSAAGLVETPTAGPKPCTTQRYEVQEMMGMKGGSKNVVKAAQMRHAATERDERDRESSGCGHAYLIRQVHHTGSRVCWSSSTLARRASGSLHSHEAPLG